MASIAERENWLHHNCEGVGGHDEIYQEPNGEWKLNIDCSSEVLEIDFCPWCGIKLI